MNKIMKDVFDYYELPFETYFVRDVYHINQQHNEIELLWLIRGEADIICDNQKYKLTDQTLFMVNVGQIHSVKVPKDSLMITYRFKNEHLHENNMSFDNYRFINRVYTFQELVIKYKEVPLLIAQLLKLLLSTNSDHVIRYKIIGYYNMFVYELYTMLLKERYLDIKRKNYDSYIDRVGRITDYVSSNYRRRITLEEIAKLVGLSKCRVSHFIKDYMGVSLQEYISNTRLEKALRELSMTNKRVSNISEDCGFSDVKYLNQAIKKRLGVTALKYRKFSVHRSMMKEKMGLNIQEFSKELSLCLEKIDRSGRFTSTT